MKASQAELLEAQNVLRSTGWQVFREYLACAEANALTDILDACGQLEDFSNREKAIGRLDFIQKIEGEFKSYINNSNRETAT